MTERLARAEALTILGDHDAAVAELRAVHDMGLALGHTLRLSLRWEPLRGHPKFQQLAKEEEARASVAPRSKK